MRVRINGKVYKFEYRKDALEFLKLKGFKKIPNRLNGLSNQFSDGEQIVVLIG